MDPTAGKRWSDAEIEEKRRWFRELKAGMPVVTLHQKRGKIQKGRPYGRILYVKNEDGRELSYHATKGWRNRRA